MKKIHALDAVKIVFQADAAAAGLFFLLRLLQAPAEERAMVRSGVMEPFGKTIGEFRTLEFRNVSFRYPGTDRAILKNLSFRIQAGEKYAFVGANGAGKTTIIKLINGLYQDYEGEILVNGEDIRAFDRDFLSNVFQDFARYPLSVRDNITIGRKGEVTDEELNAAMEEAGLGAAFGSSAGIPSGASDQSGKNALRRQDRKTDCSDTQGGGGL